MPPGWSRRDCLARPYVFPTSFGMCSRLRYDDREKIKMFPRRRPPIGVSTKPTNPNCPRLRGTSIRRTSPLLPCQNWHGSTRVYIHPSRSLESKWPRTYREHRPTTVDHNHKTGGGGRARSCQINRTPLGLPWCPYSLLAGAVQH